ncbi:MAG: tRNA (adenine-N1)-methyltransferase, partial [Proteobacteria bacterium]|nr:tRNA (adenine-N1)-methyltransferase [Pseudomonadota bacterium]
MNTGSDFSDGEVCLLTDRKGRQHLVTLSSGAQFQMDRGTIDHNDIIGSPEGAMVATSKGTPLVAFRPRLADYVLRMKRGAAVMYPKDTGPLITWADIAPGCTVVEAGTGSGALTLALSRAVGDSGLVVSVERRDDHAKHARRVISAFHGEVPANIDLRLGDVEDVIAAVRPDRIVLDLPEPWHSVEPATTSLAGGGTIVSYLPTVPQVQTFREALDDARTFSEITTFEVMMRTWTIDGRSVRPDHRMIGHTGFITVARKRLRDPKVGAGRKPDESD